MLEQLLNHVQRHNLFKPHHKIILAVSGGVDSMVMLHLFQEAKVQFAVAHCNFQLRGKESDADEQFVLDTCKKLELTAFVDRFDTEAYAWENDVSTQMAARALRYAWFDSLLTEHQYDYLATGHHFDDTLETILLNWTRGASVEGMTGIPVKNGRIIRPLLFSTRLQVEKYAANHGIAWREDQSNLTDDYQRNFIRHQIIPKLKELNPSLEVTLHAGLEKLQGDLELIHNRVEEWKKQFTTLIGERLTIEKCGFDLFRQKASLLWRCIKEFGFNFEQAHEIIHALNGQPGKKFLSPSHQIVIDRTTLIVTPHQNNWQQTSIETDQGQISLGPWHMEISDATILTLTTGRNKAALDASKLKFPLVWRKWKAGDFFYPLGMDHKKKLSDFLIDNKLSLADKDAVTVVESDGQIAWVVGYRIDDRFKLSEQTQSTVIFTLT